MHIPCRTRVVTTFALCAAAAHSLHMPMMRHSHTAMPAYPTLPPRSGFARARTPHPLYPKVFTDTHQQQQHPRSKVCKDGATSAARDRSPDRADTVPLECRGCRPLDHWKHPAPAWLGGIATYHRCALPSLLRTTPPQPVTSAGPTGTRTCEFHHESLCSVAHSYRVDSRQPSASRFQLYTLRITTFLTSPLIRLMKATGSGRRRG